MTAETSLTLLARLQQSSDPASWQRLVDLYAPLIGRWLSRSPLQSADHEDIAQEVLKIVMHKLPDFERHHKLEDVPNDQLVRLLQAPANQYIVSAEGKEKKRNRLFFSIVGV